jgi:hypothetical protein
MAVHKTTVDPWTTFRYDAIIQANRTRESEGYEHRVRIDPGYHATI